MRLFAVFVQQWHPDRWIKTPSLLGEAKRRFQQIQEAYSGRLTSTVLVINPPFFFLLCAKGRQRFIVSWLCTFYGSVLRVVLTSYFVEAVLSDQQKRTLYDAGLYNPEDDEDEVGTLSLEMCFPLFLAMNLPFSLDTNTWIYT